MRVKPKLRLQPYELWLVLGLCFGGGMVCGMVVGLLIYLIRH